MSEVITQHWRRYIYLIGSLRNPSIPKIGQALRAVGHFVYDDWFAAGPDADDRWRDYEKGRGRSLRQALNGEAARHTFEIDLLHLERCNTGVIVMPAGKSAHLEIGRLNGQKKKTYILFQEDPDRFDLMYKFLDGVFYSLDELIQELEK